MDKYIIGIDQSTQGTKVILFDENGRIVLRVNRNHRQIVNEQGWVEHDPKEIWQNLLGCVSELLVKSAVNPAQVVGVGITNQRETAAAWHRATGKPVYNAIVPETEELSCIGVAWAAGLALGVYTDRVFGSIPTRTLTALMSCDERNERLAVWAEAVHSIRK